MTVISILAMTGVLLGALSLEALLLLLLSIPKVDSWVKSTKKKIKNKFRHWWWKNFDWKTDFVEKD